MSGDRNTCLLTLYAQQTGAIPGPQGAGTWGTSDHLKEGDCWDLQRVRLGRPPKGTSFTHTYTVGLPPGGAQAGDRNGPQNI